MDSDNEENTFSTSIRQIKNAFDPKDSGKNSMKDLGHEYQEEIQNLSMKLTKADGIVKELIFSQEKMKQFLSQSRIENSNLILVNRSLKKQLTDLGAKVEENEKILKRLSKGENNKGKELRDSSLIKESQKSKVVEKGKSFAVEKMRGILINSKVSKKKKIDFCTVQHQCQLSVSLAILKKPKEKVRSLEVSRTSKYSYRSEKAPKKISFQGSLKIYPQKTLAHLKNFQISHQHFSYTPKPSPTKIKLKVAKCENFNIRPMLQKQANESIGKLQVFEKQVPKVPLINPSEQLKMFAFPIFVNQCGRAQAEKLNSDDENDLEIALPKRIFTLSISRTIKFAFVPKVKKLTLQPQFTVKIFPPNFTKSKKKPLIKFSKPSNISIIPTPETINLQVYKIFKAKKPRQKIHFFEVFQFSCQLTVQKCKGFNIISESWSNAEEGEEIVVGSQRRPRRAAKRASAIDEYFTLVSNIQTFQAVKLNFTEKDKISMIKAPDLYSKVQQLKLPFNFWYDWIKEQFNFMCAS